MDSRNKSTHLNTFQNDTVGVTHCGPEYSMFVYKYQLRSSNFDALSSTPQTFYTLNLGISNSIHYACPIHLSVSPSLRIQAEHNQANGLTIQ